MAQAHGKTNAQVALRWAVQSAVQGWQADSACTCTGEFREQTQTPHKTKTPPQRTSLHVEHEPPLPGPTKSKITYLPNTNADPSTSQSTRLILASIDWPSSHGTQLISYALLAVTRCAWLCRGGRWSHLNSQERHPSPCYPGQWETTASAVCVCFLRLRGEDTAFAVCVSTAFVDMRRCICRVCVSTVFVDIRHCLCRVCVSTAF